VRGSQRSDRRSRTAAAPVLQLLLEPLVAFAQLAELGRLTADELVLVRKAFLEER
jgi:hypothetical protein